MVKFLFFVFITSPPLVNIRFSHISLISLKHASNLNMYMHAYAGNSLTKKKKLFLGQKKKETS